jgi:Asp-tRNA(Asn)/Glu-tRNA(Gln) amidotransferase A subunit family amidase
MPTMGFYAANAVAGGAPTATEAVAAMAVGALDAARLTAGCLARIAGREPEVEAWTFLDPAHAEAQAAALDQATKAGGGRGPLFGVPVGIKDIFATADMPTENGSHLHAGRRPEVDATVVARLRGAGAVIMGKTVTTEFATFEPGKTRNPHDPGRTPGGSSSGSAAAVAAGMVPLALGSQTNGSVIRPASYCGVHGFKPSFGLIGRRGMTLQAPTVDHVGMFARSLEDIALLGDVLIGHDPADPATRPMAAPRFREAVRDGRRSAPRLAFVPGPTWAEAAPETQASFSALADRLGIPEIALPAGFADAVEVHRRISWAELAHCLTPEYRVGPGGLSDRLRAMIEGGQAISAPDYLAAIEARAALIRAMAPVFAEYDALVTPAATGEAPEGLASTGSPLFCTVWTLLGTPGLSLPLLTGPAGLPLGVQLVGRCGGDEALMATAAWLERALGRRD